MRFKLTQTDGDTRKYHLEGYDGFKRDVLEFSSLKEANQFAETYHDAEPPPVVLIRNDRVADAHGFWLHTFSRRGSGQLVLAGEKMLVACGRVR